MPDIELFNKTECNTRIDACCAISPGFCYRTFHGANVGLTQTSNWCKPEKRRRENCYIVAGSISPRGGLVWPWYDHWPTFEPAERKLLSLAVRIDKNDDHWSSRFMYRTLCRVPTACKRLHVPTKWQVPTYRQRDDQSHAQRRYGAQEESSSRASRVSTWTPGNIGQHYQRVIHRNLFVSVTDETKNYLEEMFTILIPVARKKNSYHSVWRGMCDVLD